MYGHSSRSRWRPGAGLPALCCAALATLALGCSSGGDDAEEPSDGATGPAGADGAFWVDPDGPAAGQVERWAEAGREREAELLRRISERPVAHWPTGEGDPGPQVREVAEAATADGSAAVFVAYNVPHRDCGQYSEGGAADAAAYARWIDSFAAGIEDAEAVVVLEPDAVPHTLDGCTAEEYVAERYQLLADAVDRLGEQPHTRVYLDAGNPSWIEDTERLADALRRAGVEGADGFALNVSNFQPQEANLTYGRELSELLDGAHFVVDTSRNGNGPYDGDEGEDGHGGHGDGEHGGHGEHGSDGAGTSDAAAGAHEAWCNPPGRALGTPPTTDTGDPLVDAFLWVKRPGESDGECRGGPAPGEWWPEYALELARGAAE